MSVNLNSPIHQLTKSPIAVSTRPPIAVCTGSLIAVVVLVVLSLAIAGCSHPVSPSATSASVDVLNYLLGDAALWPRVGSHSQNQIVDLERREVCWVKYVNPRRFECWRWDDQFVYHAVDHALDGDSNESYAFTDGRWLPRQFRADASAAAPWTLDVSQNSIVWYDASCHVDPSRSNAFPYRLRAWIEPGFDAGSDLGRRDTLVFDYEPYDPSAARPGERERFYLGLGAGWYEWERGGFVILFNRLGGPAISMNRQVWCGGGR